MPVRDEDLQPNALLRAIHAGLINPDDLDGQQMGQLVGTPAPNYDAAPMQQNTMRVESGADAGKVTGLTPMADLMLKFQAAKDAQAANPSNDQNDRAMQRAQPQMGTSAMQPDADLQQWFQDAKQQGNARAPDSRLVPVYGVGNGTVVQLKAEPAGNVPIDYSRPQIEIPGLGKGYYAKDGRTIVGTAADGSLWKALPGYDMAGSMALDKYADERAKTQADIAHTQEQIRASRVNTPDFGAQGGGSGATGGPAGPDLLASLDQPTAATVKALAEGRMAFPAGFALKSPYWQNMLRMVSQYDPTFDAVNFNARASTRKDFTSGKSADNLTALNTAINHLGKLSDAYAALGNGDYPVVNTVGNFLGQQFGNRSLQANMGNVSTDADALAHELAKVFRSTGMSEREIQEWQSHIDPNAPPAKMKAVIDSAIGLMQSRLEPLAQRYSQGMGTTKQPMDLLTPEAQDTISRLQRGAAASSAPGQPRPQPNALAILTVKKNPQLARDFIAKYGADVAAQNGIQ